MIMIESADETGGAERWVFGLATHLPPERFQVWLCSTRHFDRFTHEALIDAGVGHLHLGRQSKWDVHRFAKLAAVLREERIDVLHTNMFGSNFWGTLVGRASGVPVLLAHEHTWSYEGEH
jgi:hypothetical protein